MTDSKHDIVHHLEQWLRSEPNAKEVLSVRLGNGAVRARLIYGDRTCVEDVKPTLRAALSGALTKANTHPSAARINSIKKRRNP